MIKLTESCFLHICLLGEQAGGKQLPPQTRAKMVAAVAAVALLGFLLAAMIWLGGRYTRKFINRPVVLLDKSKPVIDPDDWAEKR